MPARRSAASSPNLSSQRTLAGRICRALRLAGAAAPHRGLRQQPHHGHQRGRRHDRLRPGRLRQRPVPQVQHALRGPHARRRLRHDARDARPALRAPHQGGGTARGGRTRRGERDDRPVARRAPHRRRPRPARRGDRDARRTRRHRPAADRRRQGAGPRCRAARPSI